MFSRRVDGREGGEEGARCAHSFTWKLLPHFHLRIRTLIVSKFDTKTETEDPSSKRSRVVIPQKSQVRQNVWTSHTHFFFRYTFYAIFIATIVTFYVLMLSTSTEHYNLVSNFPGKLK